jgi:nucleotide-binding universal stress UspA family protein
MKNILVPVDFSDLALDALTLASNIAKQSGAKLTALHIITLSGDAFLDKNGEPDANCGADVEKLKAEKQQKINALEEWLKAHNFEAEIAVVYGHVVSTINKLTQSEAYDMIVMGTHPVYGLEEKFSVTMGEQVVQKASIPVITLKCNRPDYQIRKMTFAHDFSKTSPNVEKIKMLQQIFDSHLHLLQVHKPGKDTVQLLEQMKAFAQENELKNISYHLVEDKNLEDGIIRFNIENQCDLLAIENRKRSGLQRLLKGNLVEGLVHHVMMPVLTFNEK